MPNGREAAIESYVPGRVRIRLPREQRDESLAAEIRSSVEGVKGVRSVFVNPATGGVLVEYDPGVLDFAKLKRESLLDRIVADAEDVAEVTLLDPWPNGPSVTAQNIIRTFKQVDRAMNRISRGVVDARTVFPLVLLGVSMGRYMFSEKRAIAPWYTLLWYSYSMFMHWNSPTRGKPSLD